MIYLDLYGEPVSQARPRVFYRRGKFSAYNPNQADKEKYRWQIRSQYRNDPIPGPVSLDLTFFMPIPKNTSGIKKRQMRNGMIHHMKRPDIDNLQKFALDCLVNIVIEDDSQIVELRARKVYSDKVGTSMRLVELNNQTIEKPHEDNRRQSG